MTISGNLSREKYRKTPEEIEYALVYMQMRKRSSTSLIKNEPSDVEAPKFTKT